MGVTEAGLSADLRVAMKGRDRCRVSVLRGVLAAVKHRKVELRQDELEETELVQILRREVRKRDEAIEFASKAGRDELVAGNVAERDVLSGYLPAMLTGERLEETIRAMIERADSPDLGTIMRGLKAECGANVDGREASELARRLLAEVSA